MARSRRDLAILAARIGAKFRNFTPTYAHHNVFALGEVADFAPGIFGIMRKTRNKKLAVDAALLR